MTANFYTSDCICNSNVGRRTTSTGTTLQRTMRVAPFVCSFSRIYSFRDPRRGMITVCAHDLKMKREKEIRGVVDNFLFVFDEFSKELIDDGDKKV